VKLDDVSTDFRGYGRDVFDALVSENTNMADSVAGGFEHTSRGRLVYSAGTIGEYHADVRRAKLRGNLRIRRPRYPAELDSSLAIWHVALSLRR